MIRLNDFYDAIKVSWIRCYAIDMIDDHWAEMIDTHYALTPDTRYQILEYGPLKFNKIIKADIPFISSLYKSYNVLKMNFLTHPNTHDNSWLHQNVFYNNNFSKKYPNNNKTTLLTPTFFDIPDSHHKLQIIYFYSHNTFITPKELN